MALDICNLGDLQQALVTPLTQLPWVENVCFAHPRNYGKSKETLWKVRPEAVRATDGEVSLLILQQ